MHKIPFLNIENLEVSINKNKILKKFNLQIYKGEIHTIMGPNGSGKSSLSKVLSGHPDYKNSEGKIMFKNIDITYLEPEQRSHMGMFLGFQYPVEIPGVSNEDFLRLIYNTKQKFLSKNEVDPLKFLTIVTDKLKSINMSSSFLNRNVNEGFSGGEKKCNEILQMLLLNAELSILDETDSGLDIDALRIVADGVNSSKTKNNAFLIITHYQRLLDYIKPDFVHVLMNGKIIKSGGPELALELEKKGYESFN